MTTLVKNLYYVYIYIYIYIYTYIRELYVTEENVYFGFFALEPELLLITHGILLHFRTLQE